jgi:uncharacterized protein (TIGR00255 family)
MSTRSMTGFARVRRSVAGGEALVSLKSVNHRALDIHFHLPQLLDAFEPAARAAIKRRVERGHVQIHISLEREAGAKAGALNVALLQTWAQAFRQAAGLLDSTVPPDPNAALRVTGMLQQNETAAEWTADLQPMLESALDEALDELNVFREREGEAIAAEMRSRVQAIEQLAQRMEAIRSTATDAFHARLTEKLSELLRGSALDPQRVAQEAAVLADRSDISEEIMRLKTHAAQVTAILEGSGEKGKKLDFLLQEMNRESNTILSKTGGLGDHGLTLTDLALAAKAEIDKMREQALNVE